MKSRAISYLARLRFRFFLACVFTLFASPAVFAEEQVEKYAFEHEVDAYYSSVGVYINLTDEPIPDLGDVSEKSIYQDLLFRSHKPRFMLFEASVYPMPVLGAYLKKHQRPFYDQTAINDDQNLVKILTAGFEEPYALSMFMGNVVTYGSEIAEGYRNKGFMGYLLSYGDTHIVNNEFVQDNWWELEWKIKGSIVKQSRNLEWSFRVGGKWHDNPAITDAMYVGIRRDQIRTDKSWLSFIDNSGVDFYLEFAQDGFTPTQQRALLFKNIPVSDASYVVRLNVGLIRTTDRRYSAPLTEDTSLQIVITPSIKF